MRVALDRSAPDQDRRTMRNTLFRPIDCLFAQTKFPVAVASGIQLQRAGIAARFDAGNRLVS